MSAIQVKNRSAYFEYHIESKYVAGIILTGTEIKAIREGRASFNDAYCYFSSEGELFLKNLHISAYSHGTDANHEPLRIRKLLLQKRELRKWQNKTKERGFTIVPLRMFINEAGLAKVEVGLAKGKKLYDKRESIKRKDIQRQTQRDMKRY